MYQFTQITNPRQFFLFDRNIIKEKRWNMWSQSAKAVYPVIASFADETGECFPSELTIAILSGRSEKVARDGIASLAEQDAIKIKPYISSRGHRMHKYHLAVAKPPYDKGRWFPFLKCVMTGGNWRMLTPTAQALYPVMRRFAGFSYSDYEGAPECEDSDFMEAYQNRDYDLCSADPALMCELAGITRKSYPDAMNQLRQRFLIECASNDDDGRQQWKVFLSPPKIYKPEYLNDETQKSFCYLLKKTAEPRWKKLPVDDGKNYLENGNKCYQVAK